MSKKEIIGILAVIIVIIIAITGFAIYSVSDKKVENKVDNGNSKLSSNNQSMNVTDEKTEDNTDSKGSSNTLVVYYSAQNHTKAVAEKIAENLNADTFEIVPKDIYTSEDLDWTDDNSRVSKEYNDKSLRNIEIEVTEVKDWEKYDTILIGYPIWWGIAAWPVDTFVKANDFSNKTIIPFCTSSSSGLGESGDLLEQEANGGNWLEGHRFRSNPSDNDIKNWTDSL